MSAAAFTTLSRVILAHSKELAALAIAFKHERSALLAWMQYVSEPGSYHNPTWEHYAALIDQCAFKLVTVARQRITVAGMLVAEMGMWDDALTAQLTDAQGAFKDRRWDAKVYGEPAVPDGVDTGWATA